MSGCSAASCTPGMGVNVEGGVPYQNTIMIPVSAVQITIRASDKPRHETDNYLHGRIPVLPLGASRTLGGLEAMVAVFQPMDADGWRKRVTQNLLPAPERITAALTDQGRSFDRP